MIKIEIADQLFYSDNPFDIPTLDLELQADCCEIPWIKWGTRRRTNKINRGTVHFYTDDYKFSALWHNPEQLLKTTVCTVVEVDYSTHDQTPRAIFLNDLYKKRWLSRFWQSHGVRILVNLNVSPKFAQDNLLGVPKGWRSYACRYNPYEPEQIKNDYLIACNHAETDKILFITYGGGKAGKAFADSIKQPWIIDQFHQIYEEIKCNG